MATTWDWASGVQQTVEQKPATTAPVMNADPWNAAPQSPQGREAPTMYSSNSPGERVESSPGTYGNYQLQPVQTTGYQNYQLGGQQQQQFVQQQQQFNATSTSPEMTNFAFAPQMPSSMPPSMPPAAPTQQANTMPFGMPPAMPPSAPTQQADAMQFGMPPAMPPAAPTQQADAMQFGMPPAMPPTAPAQQADAMPSAAPTQQANANPFGMPPAMPPSAPTQQAAETPSVMPAQQADANPFGMPPAMPAQQAATEPSQPQNTNPNPNPFGVFAPPTTSAQQQTAQPVAASSDPFGVFGSAPQPVAANNASADIFGSAPVTPTGASSGSDSSLPDGEDDFWNMMGFGQVDHAATITTTGSVSTASDLSMSDSLGFGQIDHAAAMESQSANSLANPHTVDENGLPSGGEYYQIRVTAPRVGAIFSPASELRKTIYKTASFQFVESLKNRPVVTFRIDGSAAHTAGVGIGHVLLKVNGHEVFDTETAVEILSQTPRPMTLQFYAPGKQQVHVCKTEGQCMVKYDSRATRHAKSSKEWKPKYVVIGDILGKPNVVYMYRSKHEYDIAVTEAQSSPRTVSVKVKQFDITGGRILKRGQVKYTNQPTPWYYFVVVREFGLPILISAESEEQLAPLYDGIAGYLAQSKRKASKPPQWMK